jgi:lipoprotein-releasing system permease protein
MQVARIIARRYLFAKKSHHLVNFISWTSMAGVAVGTFGLIVVLSVFNGFGKLVVSLYDSFDPDLRISPSSGKNIFISDSLFRDLAKDPSVQHVTPVLEAMALIRYREQQTVVTVKGVGADYLKTTGLSEHIIAGDAVLEQGASDFLIAGSQIAYRLALRPEDPFHRITLFMPRPGIDPSSMSVDPSSAFSERSIVASGVFGIQQDFDSRYVIVPLRFMQELSGREQQLSHVEVKLIPEADPQEVRARLQAALGHRFEVKDRFMQHAFLYKILQSETLAVYLILAFILIIAAFNLFGTLSMLILDKRRDLNTLFTLGGDLGTMRKIFMLEGLMISVGGAIAGLVLGALACGAQQAFGLIRLGEGEGYITEAYPVVMQAGDFGIVLLTALVIGYLASLLTSRIMVTRLADPRLN